MDLQTRILWNSAKKQHILYENVIPSLSRNDVLLVLTEQQPIR